MPWPNWVIDLAITSAIVVVLVLWLVIVTYSREQEEKWEKAKREEEEREKEEAGEKLPLTEGIDFQEVSNAS